MRQRFTSWPLVRPGADAPCRGRSSEIENSPTELGQSGYLVAAGSRLEVVWLSFRIPEVEINPRNGDLLVPHSNAVTNHQLRKFISVDQPYRRPPR